MTDGLFHLRGFWDTAQQQRAIDAVREICKHAPLRRPSTPGGYPMRVRITSAGVAGWWADGGGYRYVDNQPQTGVKQDGMPWPSAPRWLFDEAWRVVATCGLTPFEPDAVLVNWYDEDAFLSQHRDESEEDLEAPIVSFSLGAAAPFHLFGPNREDPISQRLTLESGDAMVLSLPARNWYHAVPRILQTDPLFTVLRKPGRISILVRKVRK